MEPINRNAELNEGAPPGWSRHPSGVRVARPPFGPCPSTHNSVLFAVIGTWNEADVVGACVKNCFANGCTNVFIVDNASEDSTVIEASDAGGRITRSYRTDFYDDDLRLRIMNEVMEKDTGYHALPLPDLWWLSLDADEFPCSPTGGRLIDWLATLPDEVNVAGANAIDMYPSSPDCYAVGDHPANRMSLGWLRGGGGAGFCSLDHWKHPLLRQRGGVYELGQSRGSHVPFVKPGSGVVPVEAAEHFWLFHAPYREREATRRRLERMTRKEVGGHSRTAVDDLVLGGGQGAVKRMRSFEAVYAGDWGNVELPHSQHGGGSRGVNVRPWHELVPFSDHPRW